ncbi:hypothetical protein SAMN05216503_0207 [Polaribacter sp. KT25b]|nr:hypothetical protein SAMN05216503_0207 [Polaribacter sp. KT25b]
MNLKIANTFLLLLKNTCICLFFLYNLHSFSQEKPLNADNQKGNTTNTEQELLKKAKDYITKKEYDKAASFLSTNYQQFSENLTINWLYAQVLSLNNDKTQAEEKFKKAISIAPLNKDLQLDYARFLYETGKIKKVESILSKFITNDSKNAEFLLMQANISFWKGDIKNSQKKIARIKEIYPDTEITKSLTAQIDELTIYYINTNFEYHTDSQPLDFFAYHIAIGHYESRFLNPKLELSTYNFSPEKEQAVILKISNQFYFDNLKLTANITGGIYKNLSEKVDWIGDISFIKKITKNVSLNVGYSKNSVLSTIASTAFNLTKQDVFGEINYSNKLLLLNAGYNQQFYKNDNTIESIGAWILSQPIKFRNFNFQLGYSYNYTDSKDILFIYDNQGVGVYNPYFTPKEQQIHSGLFIVNYKPTKKLSLEAKANYGFKATIRNPYPLQVTATSIEIGGFYDETFTPVELTGIINYSFSNRFNAKITYTNQETFFYKRENINLGLNFNI